MTGKMLCALVIWAAVAPARAGITHSTNPDNGLKGWHLVEGDISIELIQRLPDQTRAMMMNHAFSPAVIEQLALSCMFQTVIRNTGASGEDAVVRIDLARWVMHHPQRTGAILLKEPLLASWTETQADAAARLVVQWGMFPTEQEYRPTDYNWGLTAYGVPPGSIFDLDVSWEENGEWRRARIEDITCAPDVDKLL